MNWCFKVIFAFGFSAFPGMALGGIKYAKVDGLPSGACDTWASACTMEQALAVAVSGDEIWAKKTAGGPSYPPITLNDGVRIIGGFVEGATQASQSNPAANVTTIDGGGTHQCVIADGADSDALLRGFHITNGYHADSSFSTIGGGAASLENSDAVFVQCVFENNTADWFGGAVAIKGSKSPNFYNCIFRNNGSGSSDSGPDNNAKPIAGGAVYLHSGTPTFVNCLFHGNKAGEGAAVANLMGNPTFVNCTFANNYAKIGYGGALNDEGGRAKLRNCILWGNTAIKGGSHQFFNAPTVSSEATYSDVQGGWTGTGNLNVDPLFTNPAGGDFTLQATTPCDNVGNGALPDDVGDLDWDTVTSEPAPIDLAGGGRVNVIVDMGAYEIQYSGGGPE